MFDKKWDDKLLSWRFSPYYYCQFQCGLSSTRANTTKKEKKEQKTDRQNCKGNDVIILKATFSHLKFIYKTTRAKVFEKEFKEFGTGPCFLLSMNEYLFELYVKERKILPQSRVISTVIWLQVFRTAHAAFKAMHSSPQIIYRHICGVHWK